MRVLNGRQVRVDQFAEYQLFAESTQYLSERRQTVAQIYLGVATGVFGVLGLLGEWFGFGNWSLVLASAPLVAAGALVAFVWQWAIEEAAFACTPRRRRPCTPEGHLASGHSHFGYSRLERVLPFLFLAGYALYGLAITGSANRVRHDRGWFAAAIGDKSARSGLTSLGTMQ